MVTPIPPPDAQGPYSSLPAKSVHRRQIMHPSIASSDRPSAYDSRMDPSSLATTSDIAVQRALAKPSGADFRSPPERPRQSHDGDSFGFLNQGLQATHGTNPSTVNQRAAQLYGEQLPIQPRTSSYTSTHLAVQPAYAHWHTPRYLSCSEGGHSAYSGANPDESTHGIPRS